VEQSQLVLHTAQESENVVKDMLKRANGLARDGLTLPLRICVPDLGSPSWGNMSDRVHLYTYLILSLQLIHVPQDTFAS
jgi:hypothetical protein